MNTTALQGHNASTSPSEHRTFGETLAEIIPLVEGIAGYGPPVILLVGPLTLFGLLLAGPFAFLLALVVAMLVAATVLVAIAAAIVAAPYLLVRHVRGRQGRRASSNQRAAQLVPVPSTRVAA
jgi:hypothetical protein